MIFVRESGEAVWFRAFGGTRYGVRDGDLRGIC